MQENKRIFGLGLFFMCSIVLISACTRKVSTTIDVDARFQCQNDRECVSEETACNNCGCPRAVNINHKVDIDCTKLNPNDPIAKYGCNLGCPLMKPTCSNQTCSMK